MKRVIVMLLVAFFATLSGVSAQSVPCSMDSLITWDIQGSNPQSQRIIKIVPTGTFSNDYVVAGIVQLGHTDSTFSIPYNVVQGDTASIQFSSLLQGTTYLYWAYCIFSQKRSIMKLFTTASCSFTASFAINYPNTCTAELTADPTGSQYAYQWKVGGVNISGATSGTYLATNSGSYSVAVSDSNCMQVSPAQTVTLAALAVSINASATSVSCGSSVTLTASGADTYLWSNGMTGASIVVTPTATTAYSVIGTSNGCTGTASKTITVIPLSVTISGPTSTCAGEPVTLTASGADTYTWSNGMSGESITVSPTANTSYSVTGTVNGCTGSATITITAKSLPTVTMQVSNKKPCKGSLILVNLTGSPAGGIFQGEFVEDNTFNPRNADFGFYTITYTYIGTNGCSNSDSVKIKVVGPPPIDSVRYAVSTRTFRAFGPLESFIDMYNNTTGKTFNSSSQNYKGAIFDSVDVSSGDLLLFRSVADHQCYTEWDFKFNLGIPEVGLDFLIKENEEINLTDMLGRVFSIRAPKDLKIYEAKGLFYNLTPGYYLLYVVRSSKIFARKIYIGQ